MKKINTGDYSINHTIDLGVVGEVEIVVTYNMTPIIPERVSGPPEDCYEAEGGDIELYSAHLESGEDISFLLLDTLDQDDFFLEKAREHASDSDREEYDDSYDGYDDPPWNDPELDWIGA